MVVESACRQGVCHLLAPPLERSGRETPVSVDSIPLEWDHTVDVGGSSSHEDEEDVTFYSALSGDLSQIHFALSVCLSVCLSACLPEIGRASCRERVSSPV